MPTTLVSVIDVRDFGACTVRIGDLNGDGAPDLLFVQSLHATREITCLTAVDLSGRVLWQQGKPDAANGRIYSDLPVQIHDFDGDGVNEVLWVKQAGYVEPQLTSGWARERAARYEGAAELQVLDACTGRLKRRIPLPAPADDSFLLADLTGRGRRQDLVVKDRYWNLWGVTDEGRVLWQWTGATGHYPAVGDVDGDGLDEVFTGYGLIDHDGKPLFILPGKNRGDHADAVVMHPMPDGSWRLIYGNGGVHSLAPDGRALWHAPLHEAQHVAVGRFRTDSPFQVAAVNRGKKRTEEDLASFHLFDMDGHELWQTEGLPGSWPAMGQRLDWSGSCLGGADGDAWLTCRLGPGKPALIYDGYGRVMDELPFVTASGKPGTGHVMAVPAALWGDAREEVLVYNDTGACIYANARPFSTPRQVNTTHYFGA